MSDIRYPEILNPTSDMPSVGALMEKEARIVRRTYQDELKEQIISLEEKLDKKRKLLKLLEENPVILEFMNLSRG